MSESFLIKTISEKTRALPSDKAIALQDTALRLYQAKNIAGLNTLLESHGLMDATMKAYMQIAFNNGSGSEESKSSRETGLDEVIFEGLLPQFDTDTSQVLKKTLILHNVDVGVAECERVAKAIYEYRMNENKVVLPFILPELKDELEGVISSQMFPTPKNIRLVEIFRFTTKEGVEHKMRYLGESMEKRGGKYQRTEHHLSAPFWMYKFETVAKQYYVVLSKDKLTPGYCKLRGAAILVRDLSGIGENISLPNDVRLFYLTGWEPEDKTITEEEFMEATKELTHEKMAAMVFGELRHPIWFEKLVIAWLFSGKYDDFPLHLAWVSKPGCGKTKLLKALLKVFKEMPGMFDGSSSTFKDLVPAFGTTLPKEGYLARVRRIALVDEFFTLIMRASQGKNLTASDEAGQLTSLLDQTVDQIGSGKHEPISIKVRGKAFFTTNPKTLLGSMSDLSQNLNGAFVSRVLWYFMTKQHEDFIQENKAEKSALSDPYPKRSKFVQLYDFLNTKTLRVEWRKTREIADRNKELVPANAYAIYDARALHHINCLIDGVAKYNSIIEQRSALEVRPNDYAEAEQLFTEIVSTWMDSTQGIKAMPVKARKSYIPLKDRQLFDMIDRCASVKKSELRTAFPDLDENNTLDYHIGKLAEYGLIKEKDGMIYVYWHRAVKDD